MGRRQSGRAVRVRVRVRVRGGLGGLETSQMENEGGWTRYERRVDAAVALGWRIEWNDGRARVD